MFNQEYSNVMVLADAEKQLVELIRLAWIEPSSRLIQAQEDRVGAHGPGNFQAALVAIGQVAGRIIGTVYKIYFFEPVFAFFNRRIFGPSENRAAQYACDCKARSLHQHIVLGHHEVFQNRHAGEETNILKCPGDFRVPRDEIVIHALQQELLAVLVAQIDHALSRLVEARDAVEDRCFSRAIRSNKGCDLFTRRIEGQFGDGCQTAKPHRKPLHLEHRA